MMAAGRYQQVYWLVCLCALLMPAGISQSKPPQPPQLTAKQLAAEEPPPMLAAEEKASPPAAQPNASVFGITTLIQVLLALLLVIALIALGGRLLLPRLMTLQRSQQRGDFLKLVDKMQLTPKYQIALIEVKGHRLVMIGLGDGGLQHLGDWQFGSNQAFAAVLEHHQAPKKQASADGNVGIA